MQSNFDPVGFLDEQVVGAMPTKYVNVPAKEYPAIISKIESSQTEKEGKTYTVLNVTYEVDDAEAREITGLDKPTVRQSVFLDLADGKLAVDKTKNIQLGRLREALGLNDPMRPFSFRDLIGQPCFVTVEHTPAKDKNTGRPTGDSYANVAKVGKTRS